MQLISWVEQPISSLVDEKARLWKVSRSKAGAMLIERGLKNDLFADYEAIIAEIVSRVVARECRKFFNRLASILFRMYTLVAQSMYLLINALSRVGTGRQITAEQLDKVIAWSRSEARRVVVKRGEKSEAFDKAIADWLEELSEREEADHHK
jgi:hypothetical protein